MNQSQNTRQPHLEQDQQHNQQNTQQNNQAQTPDNTIKDPKDWKTGDEPMTGAQRSYIETLSSEAHETPPGEPHQGRSLRKDRRVTT